ncbi:MAG: nicotinate phosphoribosyltransferase [bacterium]|nr:nicotinate phosphoribosyltransferase [bacterium]
MGALDALFRPSLSLLTDLYHLTMAEAAWKSGISEREAVFNLFFRANPFRGGFSIACGLTYVQEYLQRFRYSEEDTAYLRTLPGNDGQPLFEREFLDYLLSMRLECDVDAVPEGTVVFPHEPLLRIRGPMAQCQVLETPLLNMVNFQTLIATKAARVCRAAQGDPVLEFGLRRAQGIDGAVTASRAAYVGGCAATSNLLAGKLFDIPVRGTHAHSWVMCFETELEAFQAYAQALPNNCVFLVDTYDTLEGVRNAVRVGRWLREQGRKLIGVRLDSGDLAYLSTEARRILDQAGFADAVILASNDLDEHIIKSLKEQGAAIGAWGVGTKLATAYDQPALGGVYKLAAVREAGKPWQYRVKVSEQALKTSTPGILQVRRFIDADSAFVADAIYDTECGIVDGCALVDPLDSTRRRSIPAGTSHTDLLEPLMRGGVPQGVPLAAGEARLRAQQQLEGLHAGIKRFVNPHQYPVGLEQTLYDLRTQLILQARGGDS